MNSDILKSISPPLAINADCLEILPELPDSSIDMVLCDLPYGVTHNSWDQRLPFEDYIIVGENKVTFTELNHALWEPRNRKWAKSDDYFRELLSRPMNDIASYWKENKQPGLWTHYKRIIKLHGVIVLFGSGMFSAELMRTGKELWRYNIVWEKTLPTGFLNANKMPLRNHELIHIFYRKLPVYHPQKTTGHPRKRCISGHVKADGQKSNYCAQKQTSYDSTERYPKSVWLFGSDKYKDSTHTTQKPVALCEELIKTYTDEGAVILDNCAGSFTTALAADNLNRSWIAIEKDTEIFDSGINRVNENRKAIGLPELNNDSIKR